MTRKAPDADAAWAAHLRSLGHDRRMAAVQDVLNSRVRQVVQMGEGRSVAVREK